MGRRAEIEWPTDIDPTGRQPEEIQTRHSHTHSTSIKRGMDD